MRLRVWRQAKTVFLFGRVLQSGNIFYEIEHKVYYYNIDIDIILIRNYHQILLIFQFKSVSARDQLNHQYLYLLLSKLQIQRRVHQILPINM